MRKSIAKKLIVYFLLLSLASTAIVGFYSYLKARQALIERIYEQLIYIRTEKENRLQSFFNDRSREVESIAELLTTQYNDSINTMGEDFFNFIKVYHKASESSVNLWVKYSDTNIIKFGNTENSDSQKIIEPTTYNVELIKALDFSPNDSGIFIEEIIPGLDHNFSTLLVGTFFRTSDTLQSGLIMVEIGAELLNEIMFDDNPHSGLGESGEAYLVGDDYLMRSNSRFQKEAAHTIKVNTKGVRDAFKNITGTQKIMDYRGVSVFSSFSWLTIEGLEWAVLAEIDVQEAMIPIYNVRNNIIFLSLLIALLLVGVVAILSNMIAAPIIKLKQETEKVSKGNYGKIIDDSRQDEIGDLISSFNHMTIQLKEQAERLEMERVLRLSSMIDGQEMERQRLSRELHDSLGQLMLAIKMKLERALRVDNEKSREILIETQALFSSTIQEIRDISNNLRPAVLSEFGLVTGLRNLVSEIGKTSDVEISFNCENTQEKFGEKIDTYLYRITQESINNALKHSKASKIRVDFFEKDNELELSISDDGTGFKENVKMGNGVSNMRERTNLLNGVFQLSANSNGKGVFVKVTVPKI
jgi:signal transduction histidine kinase